MKRFWKTLALLLALCALSTAAQAAPPRKLILLPEDDRLLVGQTLDLTAHPLPVSASADVVWNSSNQKLATVDERGHVVALAPGTVKIRARAKGRPSVYAVRTLRVSVELPTVPDEQMARTVPARNTAPDAIDENIQKIDAVYRSALGQVNRLMRSGHITQNDADLRAQIVTRAFAMYRFPWMTEKPQRYWTRAYGTRKDFMPGTVYYGLPYIQHGLGKNSINRTYNVVKAVAQGFYLDSGKGYHLLSPTKRRDGMYVGNDCSSFVGMSVWGGSHRNAWIRTSRLYDSPLYRTLSGYDRLRPCDILVRYNRHVVFFLYYTDTARTRMMILEQGGGDASDMHNTLCASIVPTDRYMRGGYRPRRLSGLSLR